MARWLKFEVESTNYFNQKFGEHAKFFNLSGENSTVTDIRATTNTGRKFYMDAKPSPTQCGQFVLLPNVVKRCFVFSDRNKTGIKPQDQRIIDYMNADFEAYKEVGTAGGGINLNDGGKNFCEWIILAYLHKGTEFFITNEYTILPIRDFTKHFDVTATYRVKRSGSLSAGRRKMSAVIQKSKLAIIQ